jgi:hypothetical protein
LPHGSRQQSRGLPGRDTFNALKLERQLGDAGIPLFATDEPINVEGMNATTILIRSVVVVATATNASRRGSYRRPRRPLGPQP